MDVRSARSVDVKRLPERFNQREGAAFLREVQSCLTSPRPRVVLDCKDVQQFDAVGILVLLRCLEEAMKRNGDVKLAAVPDHALAILERERVDRLFETFASTADAVDSFQQLPSFAYPPVCGVGVPTQAVQPAA